MSFLIACAVIGTATAAARAWGYLEKRRDARRVVECVSEDAAHCELSAFERQAEAVITLAEAMCEQAAFDQGLRRVFGEYPPMKKRPGPPPAAPGDPWQLHFDADGGADD